jgi:hypothetical protein
MELSRQLHMANCSVNLVLKAVALEAELQNAYNQVLDAENREAYHPAPGVNMTTQSKLESRIEVAANYISGFGIAYLSWLALSHGPMTWGWFNIYDSFIITSIFTAISVTRSYAWRRFFATGLHNAVKSFVKRIKL